MRDWDWGAIWRGFRWVRLGLVLLAGVGTWFEEHGHERHDPRMAAAVVRAFSEEAGFEIPAGYRIERVPPGRTAFAVRPDGRRFTARTVQAGSLARRLYLDLTAAGADNPGQEQGVQEALDGLRDAYGRDLRPEDQLAIVPPQWQINLTN